MHSQEEISKDGEWKLLPGGTYSGTSIPQISASEASETLQDGSNNTLDWPKTLINR